MVETIQWVDGAVVMIDQTRLPLEVSYVTCRTSEEVGTAIRDMIVRGAPAIGVAAAMGVALGALGAGDAELDGRMETVCAMLAATRPTAAVVTPCPSGASMGAKAVGGVRRSSPPPTRTLPPSSKGKPAGVKCARLACSGMGLVKPMPFSEQPKQGQPVPTGQLRGPTSPKSCSGQLLKVSGPLQPSL